MRPTDRRRARTMRISSPLAASVAVLALATTVWANMAAPPPPRTVSAGSALGEPAAGLRGLFIEHETLDIDLRPLRRGHPVQVDAAYRVRNDGRARTVDLLFVANALERGRATVTVDGRAVPATPGVAGALPASWRAPAQTPAIDTATGALPYAPAVEGTLAFRVTLPAGRHQVRVRYPARATAYSVNDFTPVWQLGYVLAPAREWAGFGGADVRVRLPRGWRAAASPALARHGDELRAAWTSIPADALSLSVQQPAPSTGRWYLLWLALALAVLWACAKLAARAGRALARRGRSAAWALPLTAVLTVAWTLASVAVYMQVPEMVKLMAGPFPGEYALRGLGYGAAYGLIIVVPGFLALGMVTLQAAAHRAAARQRAASPAA